MPKRRHSTKVPNNMQSYYQAVVKLTDAFCEQYLNQDYLQLTQYAAAALCRKRPSPLLSGKITSWAAGIIHSVGFVNFLFDKSNQPYINFSDLAEHFGLGKSTIGNKSKLIRDILKMYQLDHHWCLPSKLNDNSFAWMITLNGFIVDARTLSVEIQEAAYGKGLIPYVFATQ